MSASPGSRSVDGTVDSPTDNSLLKKKEQFMKQLDRAILSACITEDLPNDSDAHPLVQVYQQVTRWVYNRKRLDFKDFKRTNFYLDVKERFGNSEIPLRLRAVSSNDDVKEETLFSNPNVRFRVELGTLSSLAPKTEEEVPEFSTKVYRMLRAYMGAADSFFAGCIIFLLSRYYKNGRHLPEGPNIASRIFEHYYSSMCEKKHLDLLIAVVECETRFPVSFPGETRFGIEAIYKRADEFWHDSILHILFERERENTEINDERVAKLVGSLKEDNKSSDVSSAGPRTRRKAIPASSPLAASRIEKPVRARSAKKKKCVVAPPVKATPVPRKKQALRTSSKRPVPKEQVLGSQPSPLKLRRTTIASGYGCSTSPAVQQPSSMSPSTSVAPMSSPATGEEASWERNSDSEPCWFEELCGQIGLWDTQFTSPVLRDSIPFSGLHDSGSPPPVAAVEWKFQVDDLPKEGEEDEFSKPSSNRVIPLFAVRRSPLKIGSTMSECLARFFVAPLVYRQKHMDIYRLLKENVRRIACIDANGGDVPDRKLCRIELEGSSREVKALLTFAAINKCSLNYLPELLTMARRFSLLPTLLASCSPEALSPPKPAAFFFRVYNALSGLSAEQFSHVPEWAEMRSKFNSLIQRRDGIETKIVRGFPRRVVDMNNIVNLTTHCTDAVGRFNERLKEFVSNEKKSKCGEVPSGEDDLNSSAFEEDSSQKSAGKNQRSLASSKDSRSSCSSHSSNPRSPHAEHIRSTGCANSDDDSSQIDVSTVPHSTDEDNDGLEAGARDYRTAKKSERKRSSQGNDRGDPNGSNF